MTKPSVFIKLERQLSRVTADDVVIRWKYGREALKEKVGRKQLPHGYIDDRIAEAEADGKTISRREIQYRLRCAEVYASEAEVRKIVCTLGTWSEIIAAGFPMVEIDEEDLTEPEDLATAAHDEFEQLSLLPGFKPIIKLHGRDLKIDEATVPDIVAYRDKYRAMHEGFAKALDAIEATVEQILDGWDGNPETKAVDAYQRGTT